MKCNRSGKVEKMKLFFSLFFILMLICGCGSSGGDEPRVVKPDKPSESDISDFVGTYELEGFSLTQVSTGRKGSDRNAEYWCGRMVISSGNRMLFDFLLDDDAYTFDFKIVEIAKDHFLVDRNGCEVQIDYSRNGNKLSIMWPADRCLLDDLAFDWEFSLQSKSEEYPPADSCSMPGSDTDTDTNDIDLVGTYEMVRYQLTDSSDGSVVEGEEPDDGWSGQMTINTSNIIDIRMTIGEENLRSTWEILEIDDDGDEDVYTLLVEDQNACRSQARIVISSENENILAIGFPGDSCADGIEMLFAFNRTGNTVNLKQSIQNNFEELLDDPNKSTIQGPERLPEVFDIMKGKMF